MLPVGVLVTQLVTGPPRGERTRVTWRGPAAGNGRVGKVNELCTWGVIVPCMARKSKPNLEERILRS